MAGVNYFFWVAKNSKFPMDKWRFDKIDPHCSATLSKSSVFLSIYCKLKINFIAKSQLLYMGCPLTREHKQKKNPNFYFQKCPRPLTRACPLTGMCKYRV